MIDIGTTLNERFLLEKELGHGGMGAVYSATDQILQRSVAIKVLKERSGEEVGKKLRLEAQIAARLLHENVVRIYDFGEAEGTYYLVMEEVNGTSYSKRWRHLPLEDRLRILAQVAEALDYAHHQGVIHRDVKPANVLLTAADAPKLSDFGLSILAEQGDDSGVIRGTPLYMSPEQTRGSRLDFRTDLYSLGVMLYESATGARPFTGRRRCRSWRSMPRLPARAAAGPQPLDLRGPRGADPLAAGQAARGPPAFRGGGRPRRLRQEIDRILRDRQDAASTATAGSQTRPGTPRPDGADAHRAPVLGRAGCRRGQRDGTELVGCTPNGRAVGCAGRTAPADRTVPVATGPATSGAARRATTAPSGSRPGVGSRPSAIVGRDLGRQQRRAHGDGPFAPGPEDARAGPGRPDPALRRRSDTSTATTWPTC